MCIYICVYIYVYVYIYIYKYVSIERVNTPQVAALRLYTTSTFRVINECLRKRVKPHPLAGTTYFISQGYAQTPQP